LKNSLKLPIIECVMIFFIYIFSIYNANAQIVEPGGMPEDVNLAINHPHEYAWKLFFFLNHQAQQGSAGVPDSAKASIRDYDADHDVVWETWANATGGLFLRPGEQNTSEVYKDGGIDPGPWEALPRATSPRKHLDPNTTVLFSNLRSNVLTIPRRDTERSGFGPFVAPGVTVEGEFEVRMNKSTFDTIRSKRLYSVEGLIASFLDAKQNNNPLSIQFDLESKEVKAKWVRLANEEDKQRYHWRTIEFVNDSGQTVRETWGLSGLHIITKDLPQWFWTDFEHVDQEPQAIKEGRPSIDPTTRGPNAPAGKDGVRNETVGSKWRYYRLRGVQLTFTDQFGKPLELANTLIEPINSGPSSCLTCHAKATISDRINHSIADQPFLINSLQPEFLLGLPDPDVFQINGQMEYLQTDFLWSMPFRARGEKKPE